MEKIELSRTVTNLADLLKILPLELKLEGWPAAVSLTVISLAYVLIHVIDAQAANNTDKIQAADLYGEAA